MVNIGVSDWTKVIVTQGWAIELYYLEHDGLRQISISTIMRVSAEVHWMLWWESAPSSRGPKPN